MHLSSFWVQLVSEKKRQARSTTTMETAMAGEKKSKKEDSYWRDPGTVLILIYLSVIVLVFFAGLESAGAQPGKVVTMDEVRQGELLVPTLKGDGFFPMPLLSQDVKISVSGMVARAVVNQHFVNKSDHWIEAVYVFPLPDESAVDHLRMRIGDRVIVGQIKEKQEAKAIYEKAKREGKKTSLLSQQRPNIFTSSVANIGPGEEIAIEIEYQQVVGFSNHIFSLRFPMVVGPRYIPGSPVAKESSKVSFDGGGWAADTDRVPDASQITPHVAAPGEPAINPVRLTVDLTAGFPLAGIDSLYHGVDVKKKAEGQYTVRFTGRVMADRDFVLEWEAKDKGKVNAALFSEDQGADRYMLLMLLPPGDSKTIEAVPREVIFILDTSGSMGGTSIVQAQKALDMAISHLQANDRFNVIEFNSKSHSLFPTSRPADPANIGIALNFVDGLVARGGTEIAPALRLALDGRDDHDRVRQVVFLTDGCVGNEDELFTLIKKRLGDSRLFTIGIGSAPNSYFMTRAASMGRGTYTYIGKVEEVKEKMTNLFVKLEHPVISDLILTSAAGDTEGMEIYPDPLPDLYDQEPVVVAIKADRKISGLHLSGLRAGKTWQVIVDTTHFANRPGIATLWARKKIRSEMESLHLGADKKQVRTTVLSTALAHHLVSQYTSLVAVEQKVSRPMDKKLAGTRLKTNLPKGWQYDKVFGGQAQTATPSDIWIILGCVLLGCALVLARDSGKRDR